MEMATQHGVCVSPHVIASGVFDPCGSVKIKSGAHLRVMKSAFSNTGASCCGPVMKHQVGDYSHCEALTQWNMYTAVLYRMTDKGRSKERAGVG